MRQYLRVAALITVLASAFAFPKSGLAQDIKIATVDVETLTLTSEEGKAVQEKLKKRYDEISTIMGKLKDDIDAKEDRLKKGDRVMSSANKATLSREIEDAKIEFDRKNQDYQKEMSEMQDTMLAPVSQKAEARLAAYIKEQSYTIVIDLAADKNNVMWSNPNNDITATVVKLLNEDFKKAGGAAPAAAAPAKPPAGGTNTPARPTGTVAPATTTPRAPASTPAATPKK